MNYAKITRLEMVLAIVGAMKAGKSTTINAIVGTMKCCRTAIVR